MATYFRLFDAGQQWLDANGDPYSGGKMYVYDAGTTTARTSYEDNAGVTAHSSPIVLDSAGRIPNGTNVWVTTGDSKIKLDTSLDVTVFTEDNYPSIGDSAATTGTEWVASGLTPTYVDGDTFTMPGDNTTIFHAGRRLRITDSGGTVYATISSSSYSDPTMTVEIDVDAADTIDSGISAVSYGLISANDTSAPLGVVRLLAGTVSGATPLNFTDLPTGYFRWDLVFENLAPANDTVELRLRTSTDNGSTFDSSAGNYSWGAFHQDGSNTWAGADSQADTAIQIGTASQFGSASDEEMSGMISIYNPAAANFTRVTWEISGNTSSPEHRYVAGGGQRESAADVDAFQLQFSAGNIATMSYVLYGWKA